MTPSPTKEAIKRLTATVDYATQNHWAGENPDLVIVNYKHLATLLASHDKLVEGLKKARAALHQHYVDWDGEPEDSVELGLARDNCDALLKELGL